jgi:pyruvate/2-oxoglutarate dehydrogenase complex dihydrolipoamide acyltransferase (E2) component
MKTKVNLPKSGMGIEEGTVTRWLRAVGDKVQKGELIAEIETAKAVQEIEAPIGGTLVEIFVTEGNVAEVNTAIAVIDGED